MLCNDAGILTWFILGKVLLNIDQVMSSMWASTQVFTLPLKYNYLISCYIIHSKHDTQARAMEECQSMVRQTGRHPHPGKVNKGM
jgi:hypothetical protein